MLTKTMLNFTEQFRMIPYGHVKKVCLEQNISIGQ